VRSRLRRFALQRSSQPSANGVCSISSASRAICVRVSSRAFVTEIPSPSAMEHAPAAKSASPVKTTVLLALPAPAMPITEQRLETSPSLAPTTAARKSFPEAQRCQGPRVARDCCTPAGASRHGLNDSRVAALLGRNPVRISLTRVFVPIREFRRRDGWQHKPGSEALRQFRQQPSTKFRHEAFTVNAGRREFIAPQLCVARLRLRQLQVQVLRIGSTSAAASAA
jgi:hypothetical protein